MRHDNIDSVEIGDVSPPTELNSYDCTFFYKYFVPIGTKQPCQGHEIFIEQRFVAAPRVP